MAFAGNGHRSVSTNGREEFGLSELAFALGLWRALILFVLVVFLVTAVGRGVDSKKVLEFLREMAVAIDVLVRGDGQAREVPLLAWRRARGGRVQYLGHCIQADGFYMRTVFSGVSTDGWMSRWVGFS